MRLIQLIHRLCDFALHVFHNLAQLLVRLWRIPFTRRIVLLFVLTFLVVLPASLFNVKNSLYFMKRNETVAKNHLIHENDQRLLKATQFFEALDPQRLGYSLNQTITSNISIFISVITVSRNRHQFDSYEPRYLTQVVWQFLMQLHLARKQGFPYDINLAICNVDQDPASYSEAKYLSKFVPVFERFDAKHFSLVHPLEKEKQDYVYCLNSSLRTDAEYALLIEDDALPNKDFFPVLAYTLTSHVENRWSRGYFVARRENNLAYVKFYHPDRLLGFLHIGAERLADLFGLIAILGTLFAVIHRMVFTERVGIHVVWFVYCVYCAIVIISIGRANINEIRRIASPTFYTYTPAPSCCTPAMLFPREGATRVVKFLNGKTCEKNYGKDSVLDDLLRTSEMHSYLVQPSAVTHIGQYSALRDKLVDPFIV